MTARNLSKLATDELVEEFASNCLRQDEAILYSQTALFNRLYDSMAQIRDELKSRPGDQRSALTVLFAHANMQVRLQAARAALAVVPKESLAVITAIASSKKYPHAGDAGMTLSNLERGVLKPT